MVKLLNCTASDTILHIIREITLQHTHRIPFVIGHRVGDQLAGLAPIDGLKVRLRECGIRVPAIDFGVALIPEEYRRAIVRANDDHATRLFAQI